ncbi:HAMP domain-containing sensor histidine kinase [Clostridium sp. Marseille-Q2269]|uniref:sensor histidine kinase n=1 Tax=Clostridium sp. Marseille-Q2269 TaxID=2942205 RepID=UPI002074827A|nr:HAMP domain-containing sensor histidine kinase [Clostridium sp. Marseille-Q2269]
MLYIILILLIISVFLAMRLFYLEKQIDSLIKQLAYINESNIHRKITIGLINKRIETLCKKINEIIDIKNQSEANKVKQEKHLRQTIANMSHDIRTPLTSIMGYIQFMKLDNITEEEKNHYLCIAEKRAKALECLLNDFYELSLIESLDYELDLKRLNINKVLQEIILEKYADFANKNIEPSIEIPDKNIYIIAEEGALGRVIDNLLSNTIKYAKESIKISLKHEDNTVVLTISNIAANLTLQDVENIFDRFYMADKTRTGKGTGLGLSIAKGLVEKMNGNMKADMKNNMFNIYCIFSII